MSRALSLSLLFVAVLGASSSRAAPPNKHAKEVKEHCVAASERAITLRSQGKLLAARTELVTCGRDECPNVVKEECASSLRALDERIPTVVFGVQDGEGVDLADARLLLDDETEPAPLDGRARSLDPGPHRVQVLRGDAVVKTEALVLREGEQNRVVTLRLPRAKATSDEGAVASPQSAAIPKVVPYALAGLGVASLAFAGFVALNLDSRVADAKRDCMPNCSAAERDSLSTQLVVGNVLLIGGIIALVGAGVTWYIARDRSVGKRAGWLLPTL